ncbi:MAG: LssY C-terminal domain-containing protein [Verrucomicrobiales bacterium]|nr:LssY C-terminal domain-containing protein [Verrucomicrobiales bacterium]
MQSQHFIRLSPRAVSQEPVAGRLSILVVCWLALVLASGCASFKPAPADYQPQLERTQIQTNGPIVASVAVLSRREASRMFDLPLHKKHIQPVWLRLENNYTNAYYFLPASLDPNYFSPAEVAYMFRKTWASKRNRRVGDFMEGKSLPLLLPPHSTNDGFVFTTLDRGAKHLRVELLGEMDFRRFEFFTYAPERRFDFQRVDFQSLYPTNSIPDYTRSEVRSALESLPAAVSDRRGRGSGDPVNLVVVGDPGDIGLAFARQGWDLTEVLTFGNVFRLIGSFVFNRTWENSPSARCTSLGDVRTWLCRRPEQPSMNGTISDSGWLRLLVKVRWCWWARSAGTSDCASLSKRRVGSRTRSTPMWMRRGITWRRRW